MLDELFVLKHGAALQFKAEFVSFKICILIQ